MKKIFNSLFWRISATFMVILLLLGLVYVWITADSSNRYIAEANQRLNADIASHVVKEINPIKNGEVDTTGMAKIMHSMMVINPDVEVYLLDTQGKILKYVAPYKRVKLKEVNLTPIKTYLAAKEISGMILGDDPRNPGNTKVFSAAEIKENDQLVGYVYVILVSEEYDSALSFVMGNYIIRLGVTSFLVTLLAALVIGLIIIYFITNNLHKIIATVKQFKEGNLHARMPQTGGELNELSTTFNEMADTILGNIEDMKAVENLRRELIANVSHDLRTPLAVMRGFAETMLIKKNLTEDEKTRYLETILTSNKKLEKLVKDLFEYSKLEAKQVTPQKEAFSISELAQDASQNYKILAENKGISLSFKHSKNTPMVFADIALVERVLQNLIDNAIKFTPEGGDITISVHEKGKGVEVKVSDTGQGISEEDLPYVFDRYHKAGASGPVAATGGGAGLGLAIVKKILEIHDSTIEIKSKLKQGTSFIFQLPAYE